MKIRSSSCNSSNSSSRSSSSGSSECYNGTLMIPLFTEMLAKPELLNNMF